MPFSLASNRQTQQPGLSGSSVKCILATRVFYDTSSSFELPPAPLGNQPVGTNPASGYSPTNRWSDFGSILRSKVMMEYNKEYADVRSGLDGVYRGSYVTSKTAQASFALDNFDAAALMALTGQEDTTKKGVTISSTSFSYYSMFVGREDAVSMSLLLVGVNKIDRKEHHYLLRDCDVRFAWEEDNDAIVARVTAVIRPCKYNGENQPEDFYKLNIWDAPTSVYHTAV